MHVNIIGRWTENNTKGGDFVHHDPVWWQTMWRCFGVGIMIASCGGDEMSGA
ncbi:conserved hypothetical protein [Ricinus communis]|uniref:Uncharacterized protein n=1 Tax=Ricinus communis TaxID=3988 RepID=B9SEA5_RICCO|nr:conserved hypothetical protein [Ricinus communis]